MHERAHDEFSREKRGNMLIVRGLGVHSRNLGLSGKCDVVEFHRSSEGVPLAGEEGLWLPIPVEYKHGKAKRHEADRLQLCAQAMCLEEMLVCEVRTAYLFYGQTRSREKVELGAELRERVVEMAREMHRVFKRRATPAPRSMAACRSCSLKDICLPALPKRESASAYMKRRMKEGQ